MRMFGSEMEPYIPFSLDELNTSWKFTSFAAGIPKRILYKNVLSSAGGMWEGLHFVFKRRVSVSVSPAKTSNLWWVPRSLDL